MLDILFSRPINYISTYLPVELVLYVFTIIYRYNASPHMRREAAKQTENMLQNDIIEPSTSPYQSSILLVKKSNNTYRFAVDYQKLNAITEVMSFPIPKTEEVFDTVADSKATVYSVFDLA